SSWQTVGTAGFSVGGVSYTSIAFNPSTNEPYVSYRDDANLYKATTMKFSGGTWQTVGNVGFSTGAASSISLAFNSSTGEPYVAYKDYSKSDKAVVMKFSGGSWQSVGNAGFSANGVNYISLAFNPSTNEPYVAFRDKSSDRPTVLKYSESNIQITTDTPTLAYNVSKKAKKRISYTFTNLSLINKKYVIMRIGGRKVEVVGLRRSGTSSIVTVELKYAKWGRGSYNLAMSYKNKTKVAYKTKKGKTKYKKGWERGSVAQDSVLQIL
ncbi:MAG: hypothetical protein NTU76_00970, partial [Candidatus Taylorbacteria bacterium]|nr:hypothetical protein [Candidatus Taylorbacteria bacterium]